jgi:selenocysteine lyase/cysteine desulfurase
LAFIYVDTEFQKKLSPINVGWLSVEDAWKLLDYKMNLKNTANVFQGGTLNSFGIYAFNTSLKIFNDYGFENAYKEILSNTKYFIDRLGKIGLGCVLNNCSDNELAGIVTIKPENPQEMFNKLNDRKIICSVREGLIRFSPHFYNTHQDIDAVVDELQKF